MPWLKAGDNAATHPSVMSVQADAGREPWLLNETFGFVMRCALQSSGHMTDYHVDVGTAAMLGGPRWERLVKVAVRHGLLTVHGTGKGRTWRLLEDSEFFHIRRRAEVEWERQRQADNRNDALTGPVRFRDGDACRWCSKIVNWGDRKAARGGTYDHLDPDTQPTTVSLMVVACKGCNSRRGAGEHLQLRPAPETPLYGPSTVKFLTARGYDVTETTGEASRSDASPGSATPHPAGSRDTTEYERPHSQWDTATAPAPSWADDSDPAPSGTTRTPSCDPAPVGIPRTGASDPTTGGITRATPASDPAPSGIPRSATPQPVGPRDTTESDIVPPSMASAPPGDPPVDAPGDPPPSPGSGRSGRSEVYQPGRDGYGSGRAGPGRAGPGRVGAGAAAPAGRSRRSRRSGGA